MSERWTADEIDKLKRMYASKSAEHIGWFLGRTRKSIYIMAKKLGLRKNLAENDSWTTAEVEILRRVYPEGGVVACTPLLQNRTRVAIAKKATHLNLKLKKQEVFDRLPREYKYRRQAYITALKRQATIENGAQELIFHIIATTIRDIGTVNDNIQSLAGGGLDWHFNMLGIDPDWAISLLKHSKLVLPAHITKIEAIANGETFKKTFSPANVQTPSERDSPGVRIVSRKNRTVDEGLRAEAIRSIQGISALPT